MVNVMLIYLMVIQAFCLYQEADAFTPWNSFKFGDEFEVKPAFNPEKRAHNKMELTGEDIKLMCNLFVRYSDMLSMNLIMNSSQRRSVTQKYLLIKNTLKSFVNDDPIKAKFIFESMQESIEKNKNNAKNLDMNANLPFKWGR